MAHAVVYRHRGLNICTKSPATADDLDYFIDDYRFAGQKYSLVHDAVDAINAALDFEHLIEEDDTE